jgi:hypothetical protein
MSSSHLDSAPAAEKLTGFFNLSITQWLVLAFVLALAIFLPRRMGLSRLVTPDEHLWLNRSANFYMALNTGEFAQTRQSVHPGVTVTWAGTAGFITRYPQYLTSGLDKANPEAFNNYLRSLKDVTPLELLASGRIFMILAHTLVLLACFWYASRLLGVFPAFLGLMLVAFDPLHLALTRLLHVDGMLSNLMLLSLLALLGWAQTRSRVALIVSGAAAGLAMLTKLPAILLPPIAALIIAYTVWKDDVLNRESNLKSHCEPHFGEAVSLRSIRLLRRRKEHRRLAMTGSSQIISTRDVLPQLAMPVIRAGLLWGVVVLIVFVALWPAMWVAPIDTLASLANLGRSQMVTEQGKQLFFDGEILSSGGFGVEQWYFYPLTYLWRSTPVVWMGLLLAGVAFWKKHPALSLPSSRATGGWFLFFVVAFTILMSLSAKKYDRYLLPVYAPLDMLAGVGWAYLASLLGKQRFPALQRLLPLGVLAGVVALHAGLALNTHPYYFTYYNPLLGGGRRAVQVMQIGWGEGLDQAAQYLNQKPGVKKIKAISSITSGCFSYFFEGQDREMPYLNDEAVDEDDWQKFIESDYAVIYISQWQRNIAPPILDYVSQKTPEHTVWINGLEYARIYKLP